jgi:hypothetical protein
LYLEFVYRRSTDNTMTKRKGTKGQTKIYKALHRKLKITPSTRGYEFSKENLEFWQIFKHFFWQKMNKIITFGVSVLFSTSPKLFYCWIYLRYNDNLQLRFNWDLIEVCRTQYWSPIFIQNQLFPMKCIYLLRNWNKMMHSTPV